MPSTTRLALPYPSPDDNPDGPAQFQALAEKIDLRTVQDYSGTAAARPAANTVPAGSLYFATDTAVLSRSNGTAWANVMPAAGAVTPAMMAPGAPSSGRAQAASAFTTSNTATAINFGSPNAVIAAAGQILLVEWIAAARPNANTQTYTPLLDGVSQGTVQAATSPASVVMTARVTGLSVGSHSLGMTVQASSAAGDFTAGQTAIMWQVVNA